MNKNSGHIFRIVAGIYLIYLGVKILMDVTRKQPSNMVFMAVMSVIFIVIGAFYAGAALKKMLGISFKKKDSMKDTAALDTEEINRQFQTSPEPDAGSEKPVMTEAGPEQKTEQNVTVDESGEEKNEKAEEEQDKEEDKTSSEKDPETKELPEAEEAEKSSSTETGEEVVQLEEIAEDEEPVSEEAENDFEEK